MTPTPSNEKKNNLSDTAQEVNAVKNAVSFLSRKNGTTILKVKDIENRVYSLKAVQIHSVSRLLDLLEADKSVKVNNDKISVLDPKSLRVPETNHNLSSFMA